eukprot:15450912-Alexandrium_andersonii.AAC.1
MHMWRLMFVCTNERCQHENGVALMCSRCKNMLPVLKDMASSLLAWHRATVDLKLAYRRGEGSNRWIDFSRYVVHGQTNRGVGPGYGLVTAVAQIH